MATGAFLALSAISAYLSYEAQEDAASARAEETERQAEVAKEREERELRIQQEKIAYESKLAAEQAEWETTISLEKATFTRERIQEEMNRVHGAQVAGYAAAGLDISEGSPLQVMARTAQEASAERQQVTRGHDIFAQTRAKEASEVSRGGAFTYNWFAERMHAETGHEVSSREAEASMFRSQAEYASYGKYLSTGSSLLGGYLDW